MLSFLKQLYKGSRQGISLIHVLTLTLLTLSHSALAATDQDQPIVSEDTPAQSEQAASSPTNEPVVVPVVPQEPVVDTPEVPDLVKAIADKYKKPDDLVSKIVKLAIKYSQPVFPTTDDILAIIVVESQFNPKARNRASKGLMQINTPDHKISNPYDVEENIKWGAQILSEYFAFFKGNKRAAIIAYNCGPGNYLKGKGVGNYYQLYIKAKRWLLSQPVDINLV